MSHPKVTAEEFARIADYVRDVSGIVLEQRKTYLVESRLGPLLPKLGCDNYMALYTKAKADISGKVRHQVVDAISTQETSFFRDKKPFEWLRNELLPRHFSNGVRQLDIWCAASSTGQEIYSVAMVLKECLGDLSSYDIRILATDISPAALSEASLARYSKLQLARGLSAARLRQHFFKVDDRWQVNDDLRGLVRFRQINLLHPLIGLGRFDLVLCRNVAIYFSAEDRKKLFERIAERLRPSGALLVGSTESLATVTKAYQRREGVSVTYYTVN